MTIEIYALTHIETSKSYIGITSRKAYGNGILVSKAKKKYGVGAFYPTILAKVDNLEEAGRLERFYISLFKTLTPNGYNIALGGDGGAIHTADMKAQISASVKRGFVENPERATKISIALKGRPSPNKGKTASVETRKKLSESLKAAGYRPSEEQKKHMSLIMTGRVFSDKTLSKMSASAKIRASSEEFKTRNAGENNPMKRAEVRLKNSQAQFGKILSKEHRAKISAAGLGRVSPNKGKTPSEETRAKMSLASKGKPKSEEHKAKIRATHAARAEQLKLGKLK